MQIAGRTGSKTGTDCHDKEKRPWIAKAVKGKSTILPESATTGFQDCFMSFVDYLQ
jgi:hypothetical protein